MTYDSYRRRRTRRTKDAEAIGFDDIILFILSFLIVVVAALIIMLMSLSVRNFSLNIHDSSLCPKPKPYVADIKIEQEEEKNETPYQTLYYLYTCKPDGSVTDDRRSQGSTIGVHFTGNDMLLVYDWMKDLDTPFTFSFLSDGIYRRDDGFQDAGQERAVVKSEAGKIYLIEDKGSSRYAIVYSTMQDDITDAIVNGDDTVRALCGQM